MALDHEAPCGPDSGLDVAGLTSFFRPRIVDPAVDLEPGTRLGDITIVRLVGEGGMGRVYEGRQGMPSRTVAVKVIHPGVLGPVAMRRFEHEAQILGRLTHPGIARIYSAGTQLVAGRPLPYLVMEYIDQAMTITAYATARRLSTSERVRLFCDACVAVAHGHRMGVVHRDLKPANMLVDGEGRAKIIDFGVARCTEHDAHLTTIHTTAGHLVGTLQYMSPEQFDADADSLDARTDVYALGVVLHELLAGRLPYDLCQRPVYEAARIVKETVPERLSRTSRLLRGDLETIVAKSLEKDRGRRYTNAAELEADLTRHLLGHPIEARPPRPFDTAIRLARRHPLTAAALAGMVGALGFGLVGITIFALRADAARRQAVHLAEEASREKVRADVNAGEARQRLYVANLQAIQSSLEKRNLRQARQLAAENTAIKGSRQALEMLCLAPDLDEALAVFESGTEPVNRLEYRPDGGVLAAAVGRLRWWAAVPSRGFGGLSQHAIRAELRRSTHTETVLLPIGRNQFSAPVTAGEAGWEPALPTRSRNQGLPASESGAPRQPCVVSPDGLWLAFPTSLGRIRTVNGATGREESVIDAGRGQFRQMEFLAGRPRLATLMSSGRLTLWEADSGRVITAWGDDGARIQEFSCSDDGSRLVAGYRTDAAWVWSVYDTTSGERLASIPTRRSPSTDNLVAMFSPDSRLLITSNNEPDLHAWNADTGTLVARLQGHTTAVKAVAFASDGSQMASGEGNGHIRLWTPRTWSPQRELMGHKEDVVSLAFNPDGATLASGSIDGTIRIWASTGPTRLAELPGIEGMTAVAFGPTGDQLAVAPTGSGGVELWNPHAVSWLRTLDGPGGAVNRVAFSADGALVAAAFETPGQPGAVCVWETATGGLRATFAGHQRGATSVTFCPEGKRLLTTTREGHLLAWDLHAGQKLWEALPGPIAAATTAGSAFGCGGSRVVSRGAVIFDALTGMTTPLTDKLGQVSCVAASPDGCTAAFATAIGRVVLVDFASGVTIATLTGHTLAVQALSFSPDSTRVATGSQDGTLRLWDARTGVGIHVLSGHEGPVNTVLFTPDGSRLVSAARDGTVRIWDVHLGHQLLTLDAQRDVPEAVAIAPDGQRLVTALPDGTIRIWGLSNMAVTSARAAAAVRPPPVAPPASAETLRDRPDPAG
jgi:WD40 repeat protein